MTRNKTYVRGAVAVLGAVAITAFALPAMAATDDIDGYKSWYFDDGDRSLPVVDGDLLWFYAYTWNESANLQPNVVVNDYMEDGLEYVAQSTDVYLVNYIQTEWAYPD